MARPPALVSRLLPPRGGDAPGEEVRGGEWRGRRDGAGDEGMGEVCVEATEATALDTAGAALAAAETPCCCWGSLALRRSVQPLSRAVTLAALVELSCEAASPSPPTACCALCGCCCGGGGAGAGNGCATIQGAPHGPNGTKSGAMPTPVGM